MKIRSLADFAGLVSRTPPPKKICHCTTLQEAKMLKTPFNVLPQHLLRMCLNENLYVHENYIAIDQTNVLKEVSTDPGMLLLPMFESS